MKYYSLFRVGIMRWVVHVTRTVENRNIYRAQVRKTEEERKLGRPRLRLEDNVKMDLKEIRWYVVEWVYLDKDRKY